ncbi:LLM class flavin-dependent oxidoreductase [Streptosporangium sp. NPDC006930]|uniref:LLM class flavin-dependent oxidoreductase n=1 Tax=Streptosporangium sp. NPDC006930 TaxID=3154783 RepID=UPI00344843FD
MDRRRDGDQPGTAECQHAQHLLLRAAAPGPDADHARRAQRWPSRGRRGTRVDEGRAQAGGPPIWIGGASEAAMRRVGRSATGWLGLEFLPDEVADQLWSLARQAAQEAGRDPDALKKAIRINLEPGTSVDSLADKLKRLAESGADEAFVDAFALFPSLDQMLDFASQVIARTGRL